MQIVLLIISIFLFSCQSLSSLNPTKNQEKLNIAREAAIKSNFDLAIENYKKAINANSSLDEVLEFAKVLRAAKKTDEAIILLESHYNKSDEAKINSEINQELGNSYMEIGNLKKAEEYLNRTLDIDATNWKAAASLGLINGLQEDFKESRHYFEIALSLGGENYSILNNYANIERLSGNNKKAKKLYKRALKQNLPRSIKQSIEKQIKEIK
ncbi:MAG: hypothetical protein J0G32_07535 [Alphaproteobacteria bacterium]|nr:hypothetical protein [Alphaproteobacteria bacterium]